jgi:hypothetical protein
VTAMGATTDDALARARTAVESLRWLDDDARPEPPGAEADEPGETTEPDAPA